MSKEKPARKPKSGYQKLKDSGKRAVMLSVSPENYELLARAAKVEMRPVSQFIVFYAIEAAKRICSQE